MQSMISLTLCNPSKQQQLTDQFNGSYLKKIFLSRTLTFRWLILTEWVLIRGVYPPQDLWRKFPPNLIGHRSFMELDLEPSIKYVTLFLANFDPLSLSHYVAHPVPPQKVRHTSRTPPPIFSRPSTKIPDK